MMRLPRENIAKSLAFARSISVAARGGDQPDADSIAVFAGKERVGLAPTLRSRSKANLNANTLRAYTLRA
jgi:hypothetical protein